MKKLIFLFTICLALFTSCQKSDELIPQKQYLTVEVLALSSQTIDLDISIISPEVNIQSNVQVINPDNQIVFKKSFYVSDLSKINFTINASDYPDAVISINAYLTPGKSSFKILDSNTALIQLIDNAFKPVLILPE